MPVSTTVGRLLVDDALPEPLRGRDRTLNKAGVTELLKEVARDYPEQYREVSHKLLTIGKQGAQETGGMSFGLQHLRKSQAGRQIRARILQQLREVLADDHLSDQQREELVLRAVGREMEGQGSAVFEEAMAAGNPLALQVHSGTRGSKINLASLLGSDLLYSDHHDKPIPIPILRSYSEGLSPWEYWAGAYGARKGTMATKFATRDAGFLGKQLNQVAHRLVVVGDDYDDPQQQQIRRGYPVDTDDPDNEGALLASDTGPYPRNTVLSPKVLRHLARLGHKRLLVRSPIAGGSPEGGVYARDVGVRERGTLPGKGELVGMTAAQALSEPISQGQLCLAAGTLVRMADWTIRPIEKVQDNEWVLGADKSGRLFPVRVVRVYDNGVRDCVRTIFREAKTQQVAELVSTGEHKLLAKTRRWALPSERVEYGVFPVAQKCVGYSAKMPVAVTNAAGRLEPFAALCGLLLGDGGYTVSVHGVYWSCYEPDLVAATQPYLASLGLRATKLQGHDGYYRISQIEDKVRQDLETGQLLPGDRNPALIWLKRHRMYGKYAHEKEIPEEVWEWNQESVAGLLGGLFATDGSVYAPTQRPEELYVNFSSTSLRLAKQVKELLQVRFAIFSSSIGWHKGKRKRRLYSFTITRKEQVRRFAERIPVPARKGQTLAKYLPGLQPDESTEYFHRRQQEPIGSVATYDLEVAHPDHLFVLANGLIVSNSAKHSGGIAGTEKAVSGFDYINQLIQVPRQFQGGAAHAQLDGTVQRVEPAPAGGYHVTVDGQQHYVSQGQALKVKKGDTVEAGDLLSEGIPDPREVVHHKGIGEGSRYFVQAMYQAMRGAGMRANRRNIELLARGLINHVRLTDEYEDYVPGDVLPYRSLEHTWRPRENHQVVAPRRGVGQYLEQPVLHYTIGTRVRPSMLKDFEDFGIQEIAVHPDPPPFEPEMIRGMYSLQHDPDWMTRMYGSGLKKGLLDAVHRGGVSDERGTSFVPSLARSVDFGRDSMALIRPPEPGVKPALPEIPKLAFDLEEIRQGLEKRALGDELDSGLGSVSRKLPATLPTPSELPRPLAPAAPTQPGRASLPDVSGGNPYLSRQPTQRYQPGGNLMATPFGMPLMRQLNQSAPGLGALGAGFLLDAGAMRTLTSGPRRPGPPMGGVTTPPPAPPTGTSLLPGQGGAESPGPEVGPTLAAAGGAAAATAGVYGLGKYAPGLRNFVFGNNYGVIGKTLQKLPAGLSSVVGVEPAAAATSRAGAASRVLGKVFVPATVAYDAITVGKNLYEGDAAAEGLAHAQEISDAIHGASWPMKPVRALGTFVGEFARPFRTAEMAAGVGGELYDATRDLVQSGDRGQDLETQRFVQVYPTILEALARQRSGQPLEFGQQQDLQAWQRQMSRLPLETRGELLRQAHAAHQGRLDPASQQASQAELARQQSDLSQRQELASWLALPGGM